MTPRYVSTYATTRLESADSLRTDDLSEKKETNVGSSHLASSMPFL